MSERQGKDRGAPVLALMIGLVLGLLQGLASGAALAQQARIEGGASFADLGAALAAAPDGASIRVEGVSRGRFVLDRRVTLRAAPGAVLDAGGQGTVLVIAADDVTVEGFTITGSGLSGDYWESWGAAGVRIDGDRAVLAGLNVTGNAWGVIFHGGQGSVLRDSTIADNQRDGILLQGGSDHAIRHNLVARNRVGVFVDSWYGDNARVLVPLIHDPAWTQQVAATQAGAAPAQRHLIAENEVRGNASTGIRVQFHASHIRIEDNQVWATGIERQPDAAERAFWMEQLRITRNSPLDMLGSGIAIYCLPEDGVIAGNESHDNLGAGVYLSLTLRNQVARNALWANAVGIDVASAQDNEIVANRVADNREFGIRLAGWVMMGQGRPDRNLIHLNDLAGNAVNAFDASDQLLTAQQIADDMALMPWPESMRMVYDNPVYRLQAAEIMAGQQRVAHNHWDDGSLGNRYDDFDAPDEGFVDREPDGIGEAPHAIAGGGALDTRPLTAERLAQALGALRP